MKRILDKPYIIFWLGIPFTQILGFLDDRHSIDLQLSDTYYVLAPVHAGIVITVVLLVIGWIYWLVRDRQLTRWMTLVHALVTLTTLVFIASSGLIMDRFVGMDFARFYIINQVIVYLFLLFCTGQLLFLINLSLHVGKSKEEVLDAVARREVGK